MVVVAAVVVCHRLIIGKILVAVAVVVLVVAVGAVVVVVVVVGVSVEEAEEVIAAVAVDFLRVSDVLNLDLDLE